MKFMYYQVAIGGSNLSKKLKFMKHNLKFLYKDLKMPFSVMINAFSDFERIERYFNKKRFPFVEHFYFHHKKGILSELWLENTNNDLLKDYDYLLFIFDDIKILKLDIGKMISVKKQLKLLILSPTVLKSSYDWMKISCDKISINNCLEVFCFLMTPRDFKIYASLHNIKNCSMWGPDLMMGYLGFRVGLHHGYKVKHMFKNKLDRSASYNRMLNYLKPFEFNHDLVFQRYPPNKDWISLKSS